MSLLQFLHFQGVGQVELKALVIAQTMPQLFQEKGHLEVPYGVGRHHQFKGIIVFQDVVANEAFPAASPVLLLEFPHCLLAGPGNKGHGTRSGVEQGDALGGETVATVKPRL